MLNRKADRRESCSLLELSHPNTQQLQLEHEQTRTNEHPGHTKMQKVFNTSAFKLISLKTLLQPFLII